MSERQARLLQDSLDMLNLRALSPAPPMHGFGIGNRIIQVPDDMLHVGAVFTLMKTVWGRR
jgi:hypothetical protein